MCLFIGKILQVIFVVKNAIIDPANVNKGNYQ